MLDFSSFAMLREIHIQNYAVIENLNVEFEPGLNVLSGETGSGKSILIDALGLALGGRATADLIRTGQERASVTAIFRAERKPAWQKWLEEYGIAGAGESEIILRREVQSGGRSRLLVNDQPVTVMAVKALAPMLLEIHGQSEHVALLERSAQLDLLDQFTEADDVLAEVGALHARRRELEREAESLSENEQDRLRLIDLFSFQLKELEQARLAPGEDGRLEEEKTVLANFEKIRTAANAAYGNLYEEEGSALSRLVAVSRAMNELARYDPFLAGFAEPLASACATLDDMAQTLRDYAGKLQSNPQRLIEIEDRLALIDRLKRKYGKSIEEIIAYRDDVQRQLDEIEHADERREEVAKALERVAAEYLKAARKLSSKRREAAGKLEKVVRTELGQLGMEKARFQICFEDEPDNGGRLPSPMAGGTARGIDEIEFRISPNPGEDLRALERIVSGGELSRLMLALKTVVGGKRLSEGARAARRVAPTFIFDEIDAGIGGRIAGSVGRRLKRLAREAQVLCVTHQAQIACFADHHLYVEKQERAGRTLTSIAALDGEKQRATELARMLSGAEVTETALKHAAAMLKQAANA